MGRGASSEHAQSGPRRREEADYSAVIAACDAALEEIAAWSDDDEAEADVELISQVGNALGDALNAVADRDGRDSDTYRSVETYFDTFLAWDRDEIDSDVDTLVDIETGLLLASRLLAQ